MLKKSLTKILPAFSIVTTLYEVPCIAQEKAAVRELQAIVEEAYLYGFPMVVVFRRWCRV